MKNILISLLVTFTTSTCLASLNRNCSLFGLYEREGWVIHSSSEFDKIEQKIDATLRKGLESGKIVFDMSGPIVTSDTVDGGEILLAGFLFDDLSTPQEEMYGDIALVEAPSKNNIRAEIRWYETGKRHIVFNSRILTCFSEVPPFSDNSVF